MPSTINTAKPTTTGSTFGITVSDARNNFVAAAADINALEASQAAHGANTTTAHGVGALLTSKADYEAHKANNDGHNLAAVRSDIAANNAELVAAKGDMPTVNDRLSVAMQANGVLKLSALQTRWIDNSDTPAFVSGTVFTVPGDRTKVYLPGVIIRATINTGYVYGIVMSSSFGSVTTVSLEAGYPVLAASLSKVELALYAFANNLEAAIAQNAANIVNLQNQITSYVYPGGAYPMLGVGNLQTPLLDLPLKNSLAMRVGAGSATMTRSTSATYLDRFGVLKTAAPNEARFEKNGVLIEGAVTNILLHSNDYSQAAWTKQLATASLSATKGPDEVTDSYKIIGTASTGTHKINQNGVAAIGKVTLSAWAKASERTKLMLQIYNGTDLNVAAASFDLSTGVVIGAPVAGTASITAGANGWYRLEVSGTTTVTTSTCSIILLNAAGSFDYTCDGVSGAFVFGVQYEATPFATSLVTSTSSQGWKAGDALSVPFANNIPPTLAEYTILADYSVLGYFNNDVKILNIVGESWRQINASTGGALRPWVASGTHYLFHNAPIAAKTVTRIGLATSLGGERLYINGVLRAEEFTKSPTTGTGTSISIGSSNGSSLFLFGHISGVRIYDRFLTESEMKIA